MSGRMAAPCCSILLIWCGLLVASLITGRWTAMEIMSPIVIVVMGWAVGDAVYSDRHKMPTSIPARSSWGRRLSIVGVQAHNDIVGME